MANSILNVGGTGSGKTTFVKKSIIPNAKNIILFDMYGDEYNEVDNIYTITKIKDFKGGLCRIVLDKSIYENSQLLVDTFWSELTKLNNTTFVMEDATIFLDSRRDNDVKQLLVEKRHSNMSYVWLFHSVSEIPPYIYKGSNAIRIGKTKDIDKDVINKFRGNEELIRAYMFVKNSKNKYESKFLKL